jgi:GNAT superfamily N-acetyltransferase
VLAGYRNRGIYRALLAMRLKYATEHSATMAFTYGRAATSSPILQRLGFTPYGRQHLYRIPLP